jgi:hypothetical protein
MWCRHSRDGPSTTHTTGPVAVCRWAPRLPNSNGIFRLQLRDTPLERPYPLLGLPKILGIEHADFLAVGSVALDPVAGVVRYVNGLVCQTLNLKLFRGCVLSCELRVPS